LDKPPNDLFLGSVNSSLGRICLARHPLMSNVKVNANTRLPGAINSSYVDGHAGRLALQKIKTVYWHVNYVPVEDPWKTSP
jgi:prepilin-type processing-associated H-X9-DG protein